MRTKIKSLVGCRITRVGRKHGGSVTLYGVRPGSNVEIPLLVLGYPHDNLFDGNGNYFDQDSILALDTP